jgi:hypothetical protein
MTIAYVLLTAKRIAAKAQQHHSFSNDNSSFSFHSGLFYSLLSFCPAAALLHICLLKTVWFALNAFPGKPFSKYPVDPGRLSVAFYNVPEYPISLFFNQSFPLTSIQN